MGAPFVLDGWESGTKQRPGTRSRQLSEDLGRTEVRQVGWDTGVLRSWSQGKEAAVPVVLVFTPYQEHQRRGVELILSPLLAHLAWQARSSQRSRESPATPQVTLMPNSSKDGHTFSVLAAPLVTIFLSPSFQPFNENLNAQVLPDQSVHPLCLPWDGFLSWHGSMIPPKMFICLCLTDPYWHLLPFLLPAALQISLLVICQ